ncbi:MAG: extracellular solute-binding protein [Treponema sp.]|nr:extracellular solute-binding protein [Treponema sp.]
MNKFLKVGLSLLVMLCVASMVFAGGNRNQSSDSGATLRLGIYPEADQGSEITMHREFLQKFNEKWPNVTVQPAHFRYQLDTFMPLAQSGRVPTIFETWFTEIDSLLSGPYVRDITAELKAMGWDTKMNTGIRDLLTRNGKIYGLPRDGYVLGLHVNAALFRQAGLVDSRGIPQYPKTWAELAQVAVQIKQRTGQAGICILAKDNAGGWHFSNIAWNFGATFSRLQGGKYVANLNSTEVIEALQYIKDLKWVHDVLTADPTNEDWGTGWAQIGTGMAAMLIGAADGVNQPTEVYGMPVSDYMIAPMPAGPRGQQFSLLGGTFFAFGSTATSAEVTAALNYLSIMGRVPEVNSDTLVGLMRDARRRKEAGIPVIPDFPAWTYQPYLDAKQEAIDSFANVDQRMFADYYTTIAKSGNVRPEEVQAQDLYGELAKCLQAVITDRNADPRALLETANRNYQALLDQGVNKGK